jgi:hypothetical protein
VEVLGLGDQVVEVLANRFCGRVAKQGFRGRIPGDDARVEIADYDRAGTDLEQRREVFRLLDQLFAYARSVLGYVSLRGTTPAPALNALMANAPAAIARFCRPA